jgi:F420H(2)-dependent biliverdin reductase
VLCQVDRRRWLSLEGVASVARDPSAVAEAVRRYAERYRTPSDRPDRVVIEIAVDRVVDRV